ncbi:MAG: hypothetical protein WD005_04940, partial [Haliea sp.]
QSLIYSQVVQTMGATSSCHNLSLLALGEGQNEGFKKSSSPRAVTIYPFSLWEKVRMRVFKKSSSPRAVTIYPFSLWEKVRMRVLRNHLHQELSQFIPSPSGRRLG